jgi:hypothetical protein
MQNSGEHCSPLQGEYKIIHNAEFRENTVLPYKGNIEIKKDGGLVWND